MTSSLKSFLVSQQMFLFSLGSCTAHFPLQSCTASGQLSIQHWCKSPLLCSQPKCLGLASFLSRSARCWAPRSEQMGLGPSPQPGSAWPSGDEDFSLGLVSLGLDPSD